MRARQNQQTNQPTNHRNHRTVVACAPSSSRWWRFVLEATHHWNLYPLIGEGGVDEAVCEYSSSAPNLLLSMGRTGGQPADCST